MQGRFQHDLFFFFCNDKRRCLTYQYWEIGRQRFPAAKNFVSANGKNFS
jgi:hypothetical protein